ncbi:hypothetical protein QOT17_024852 [Balamuthia mandrillaris]
MERKRVHDGSGGRFGEPPATTGRLAATAQPNDGSDGSTAPTTATTGERRHSGDGKRRRFVSPDRSANPSLESPVSGAPSASFQEWRAPQQPQKASSTQQKASSARSPLPRSPTQTKPRPLSYEDLAPRSTSTTGATTPAAPPSSAAATTSAPSSSVNTSSATTGEEVTNNNDSAESKHKAKLLTSILNELQHIKAVNQEIRDTHLELKREMQQLKLEKLQQKMKWSVQQQQAYHHHRLAAANTNMPPPSPQYLGSMPSSPTFRAWSPTPLFLSDTSPSPPAATTSASSNATTVTSSSPSLSSSHSSSVIAATSSSSTT